MLTKEDLEVIIKVEKIARQLHDLLRENSLHRLRLYQEHPADPNDLKWTPDTHRQNLLIESLCKNLDTLINQEERDSTPSGPIKNNNKNPVKALTH